MQHFPFFRLDQSTTLGVVEWASVHPLDYPRGNPSHRASAREHSIAVPQHAIAEGARHLERDAEWLGLTLRSGRGDRSHHTRSESETQVRRCIRLDRHRGPARRVRRLKVILDHIGPRIIKLQASPCNSKPSTSIEVKANVASGSATAVPVKEPKAPKGALANVTSVSSPQNMFALADQIETLLKGESNKTCSKILNMVGSLHAIRAISVDRPIGQSLVGKYYFKEILQPSPKRLRRYRYRR